MTETPNPFRAPLEAMTSQEMASRIEGCSAALQILNQVQQQSTLGLADQIRTLSERVTALELLVLRFVDADSVSADKRKTQ
jgi:hypothetical protein